MARKIELPPEASAVTDAPQVAPTADAADEMTVLYPDIDLKVGGRDVTVREYRFVDGLRLAARMQPLVEALCTVGADGDNDTAFHTLQACWAEHIDTVLYLVAQAVDGDEAFVRGLNDADGQTLLLAWWAANGGFFVRRVQLALQLRAAAAAGATSSSVSPEPDVADPISSATATPADS